MSSYRYDLPTPKASDYLTRSEFGNFFDDIGIHVKPIHIAPIKVGPIRLSDIAPFKAIGKPIHVDVNVDAVGKFLSNCAKTVGREIGKAEHVLTDIEGNITDAISKIPFVGGPISSLFDAAYHLTMGPALMLTSVASGQRIDRAILNTVSDTVKSVKTVAEYTKMVIGLVPGVGTGIGAALGAGLALADGQPIDKAMMEAAASAIPGGALAKAGLTMADEGVRAAIDHTNLDLGTIAQSTVSSFNLTGPAKDAAATAINVIKDPSKANLIALGTTSMGYAANALPLPGPAKDALMTGVNIAGQIAHGAPVDTTLSQAAINALPIDPKIKKSLSDANSIAFDLAHGKPLDAVVLNHIQSIASDLPIPDIIKQQLNNAAKTGASIIQGVDPTQAMLSTLNAAVGNSLLNIGSQGLPTDVIKAIQTGIALANGAVQQNKRLNQLTGGLSGKLTQAGLDLVKSNPTVAEARKLAGQGTRGFDTASGLASQKASLYDIIAVRDTFKGPDQIGYDMALSMRNGLVAHPPKPTLSPAAQAGHAITKGLQGHAVPSKQVIIKLLAVHPSASVGATQAIKDVADDRESWIHWLLRAFHLT